MRPQGMMIAVYTPMKSDGLSLDLGRIPAYAAYLRSKNITNVMPAGSNGESLSLTVPERKALAEAWAATASSHGLKIYMHIGSESLPECIEVRANVPAAALPMRVSTCMCTAPRRRERCSRRYALGARSSRRTPHRRRASRASSR
jgi:dihydrodipicolinate synthase/N-acetylneuraminate lyase